MTFAYGTNADYHFSDLTYEEGTSLLRLKSFGEKVLMVVGCFYGHMETDSLCERIENET